MDRHQRAERMAAARAFTESLEQLQDILARDDRTDAVESEKCEGSPSDSQTNSAVWEEAAADLDELLGEAHSAEDGEDERG
jgi:hypothetical protein